MRVVLFCLCACMGCGSLLGVDFDNAVPREETPVPVAQADASQATAPASGSQQGSTTTGEEGPLDASRTDADRDSALLADAGACQGTGTGAFESCVDNPYPTVPTCGHYCASIGKCCTDSCLSASAKQTSGLFAHIQCRDWTMFADLLATTLPSCSSPLQGGDNEWSVRCCCF